MPVLDNALKAAQACGIPVDKVFVMDLPGAAKRGPFKRVDDLVAEGESLPELEPLRWTKGQGARQVAFLCYSSGTSGMPVSEPRKEMKWKTDGRARSRGLTKDAESSDDISPKRHCERNAI
jgi:hypothetical protein